MENESIELLKEISRKLDDILSECNSISRNVYDVDKIKETVEDISTKIR